MILSNDTSLDSVFYRRLTDTQLARLFQATLEILESVGVRYYDAEALHMKVDADRCLGAKCGKCWEACTAKVPRFYAPEHNHAMVCDLCEKDGERKPQCVEICPSYALEFMVPLFPQHMERIHPDEKVECFSKRLYPLPKDKIQRTPQEIWGE